ncbi:MAG: F0F1 ATP synthase subunit B, partial [Elusimicrobiota bacterium]
MDTLLNPDIGLVIWTIASFLILVTLLRVLAWKPLLGAIEARESRMREEREKAELARREAERIQQDLESRLSGIEEDAKKAIAEAH